MTRVAIFASGRGSNFEAILRTIEAGALDAEVVALVCDRVGAPAISKAEAAGVRSIVVPKQAESREAHEERIWKDLRPLAPSFVVLAGYMRILSQKFIQSFRSDRGYSRIVNVHPSLLPAFPGVDSYRQAFRYGATVTGVTIHLVDNEVDSGPICAQEAFFIGDCVSEVEVEERGLAVEHRLYPQTLRWVLSEKFDLVKMPEGGPRVRPH